MYLFIPKGKKVDCESALKGSISLKHVRLRDIDQKIKVESISKRYQIGDAFNFYLYFDLFC